MHLALKTTATSCDEERNTMQLIDEFGFLKMNNPLEFDIYKLQPIPNYDKQLSVVNKHLHKDGFYYTPTQKSYRWNLKTGKLNRNALPNTTRPALLHKVAVTHQVLSSKEITSDQFRKTDGYFLLSFLGFIFDTRLQFWNWWWDSRINIKQDPVINVNENQLPTILSEGLNAWQTLSKSQQKTFLNALFLFQRGKAMEWHYEKFIHYYISLDAIWHLGSSQFKAKKKCITHKDRILTICQHLNICYDVSAIELVYKTRNDLFHEGLFGGLNPLSDISHERFSVTLYLEQLIERMLIATLGFRPSFLSTPWWGIRGWQMWN